MSVTTTNLAERYRRRWDESAGPPDVGAFLAETPDATDEQRTEVLLVDQGRRWRTDEPRTCEEYVAAHPWVAEQPSLLLQLVVEEFGYREERGEQPTLADYADRFPGLAEDLARALGEVAATVDSDTPGETRSDVPGVTPGDTVGDDGGDVTVIGPYHVLESAGAGGMGVVYRARHSRLGKIVALKVLPREASSAEAVARFEREMLAVGRLDHDNIVRAHDGGEHDGRHYLVMEFVDGVDLAKLVARTGPLGVGEACEIVRQAALGLDEAHRHGIVHRDVKPSNLMLTHDGVVKVLDLGLARTDSTGDLTALSRAGQMMGTAEYMAPEQFDDVRDVDARTDVYALGCTLYHLLAGRAPFPAARYRSVFALRDAHRDTPPPSPGADVPAELRELLSRALAKHRDDRPATAADLARALARFAVRLRGMPTGSGTAPTEPLSSLDTSADGGSSEPDPTESTPPDRRGSRWEWLWLAAPVVAFGLALPFLGPEPSPSRPFAEGIEKPAEPPPPEEPPAWSVPPKKVLDAEDVARIRRSATRAATLFGTIRRPRDRDEDVTEDRPPRVRIESFDWLHEDPCAEVFETRIVERLRARECEIDGRDPDYVVRIECWVTVETGTYYVNVRLEDVLHPVPVSRSVNFAVEPDRRPSDSPAE